MHKNRVVEHGAKDDVTMRSGSLWQAMPAPRGSLLMCLVVPVRNEALVLASTLASIAAQRTLQGTPFDLARVEVLVLANNCTDDSASIAQAFAQDNPAIAVLVEEVQLPAAQAHIGHVRRLLMDGACQRLERFGSGGFVVSTDADTVVDPYWLASMLPRSSSQPDQRDE